MATGWRQMLAVLLASSAVLISAPGSAWASGHSPWLEVRTRVTVRNLTQETAKDLVITLPQTVADRLGEQRVVEVEHITLPAATRERPAGVEYTYRLSEVKPDATVVFEQRYLVDLAAGGAGPSGDRPVSSHLAVEPGVEVHHPAIQEAGRAAVAGIDGVDERAEALLGAVVERLDYDWTGSSVGWGALQGLEAGYGVCEAYASLFVAMSRAVGLPARLVYGWADDTGLRGQFTAANRHVWAEYYHPVRGWVSVDPTFAEHQQDLRHFDPGAHLAQGLANTSMTASFGGRGLLSIQVEQSVIDVERLGQDE